MRGDFIMTKKKEIKVKLEDPSMVRKKNPYLKKNGSFSLIDKFPVYKDRSKDKKKRVISYDKS